MNGESDLKYINDIIAERFANIEAAVASARSVADVFERLLDGVKEEFGVPFVWIALRDCKEAQPVIDAVLSAEALAHRYCVVSSDLLDTLLTQGEKPVLANQNLQLFYRLLPKNRKFFIRSIAVAPIALDGRIIGVWNNGDSDENRYEPDMKTDFIAKLARRVSDTLTKLVAQMEDAPAKGRKNEIPGGPYA